jgi:HK97 family phage major capsid protein
MNPNELKRKRAAALDAMKALMDKATAETRALTTEETADFDAQEAIAKSCTETIDRAERMAPMLATQPQPRVQVHDNHEDEPFRSLGDQMMSVISTARRGIVDPRLHQLEMRAATGMSEAIPADGGFLVQKDFATTIFQQTYATGSLLSRCNRLPLSPTANGIKIPGVDETSRADGYRYGGVRGYWVNEGTAPTTSKPKFFIVELALEKVAATVYLTDELIQEAAALEAYIMKVVPSELKFKAEDAVVNGDGVGKPLGILNAPCLVSVAKETGQLAKTIVYENICNMYSRCASELNAIWLVNKDVMPQLFTMGITIGTGGSPVFLPPTGAAGRPYSTLFGLDVIPVEYCKTLGTVGDIILADMQQYYVIDKGGVQAASSLHVAFLTDEQVLRFIYRIDGEPSWKSAVTPVNSAATVSPFVALAVRA